MGEEPNLEERLSEDNSENNALTSNNNRHSTLLDKIKYHSKYFVVDGSSNAAFYAPIMTVTERFAAGMEWEQIETTRGYGAVTAFLLGYFYNSVIRKRGAKTIGVNTQSSWIQRTTVDVILGMATTAPTYVPMLYVAGTSTLQMALALFFGSVAAAVAGGLYGHLADKWRIYCGLEPVLNKS